jgi:hypothetical protein
MKNLEKILTEKLDLCVSTDYLDKAIEICENHLHFMQLCKDKRQMVVFTLSDNPDYCCDLVEYYLGNGCDEDFKTGDTYYINQFTESLSHDLLGLYNKDEHFAPRINNKTV